MIDSFTTEATSRVFHNIANDPDTYEIVDKLVREAPATAPNEIRSFVEQRLPRVKDDLARELLQAGLRDVRWHEIRTAFQRRQ